MSYIQVNPGPWKLHEGLNSAKVEGTREHRETVARLSCERALQAGSLSRGENIVSDTKRGGSEGLESCAAPRDSCSAARSFALRSTVPWITFG